STPASLISLPLISVEAAGGRWRSPGGGRRGRPVAGPAAAQGTGRGRRGTQAAASAAALLPGVGNGGEEVLFSDLAVSLATDVIGLLAVSGNRWRHGQFLEVGGGARVLEVNGGVLLVLPADGSIPRPPRRRHILLLQAGIFGRPRGRAAGGHHRPPRAAAAVRPPRAPLQWWSGGAIAPSISFFFMFSKNVCRVLVLVHGKEFTVCVKKGTRQTRLCLNHPWAPDATPFIRPGSGASCRDSLVACR
ncbi:unnamed protein product, partial [Urochloa humidicola]